METGPQDGSDVVIAKGLSPGERVVVEGIQKIRNGAKVAPESQVAAPGSAPVARRRRADRLADPGRVEGDYFFVRRPIVAIVISIVMTIVGLVAMGGLPIAQYPDIVPPEIQVQATYTGADALTIEQSVATPIEQQVNGVDYMIYMHSVNANDGTMTLRVSFEVETNIDMDNVLVQNRVSQADASLPVDVRNFGVTVKKSTANPLILFSLYSPNGTYDDRFLGNYATINIVDQLKRVPGVGDVIIFGTSDYAMRIWVKPDQLARLGLTVPDLVDAIQKQNAVNPSGKIGGEPAPPGQEFTLHRARPGPARRPPRSSANIVVRSDPSRRAGAPLGRRAHRARRAELQPARPPQRQAGSDHLHLPDPGLQRARGRRRPQGA